MTKPQDPTDFFRGVVQDVVAWLVSDDWFEMTLPDGRRYFVVGADAWNDEVEHQLESRMCLAGSHEIDGAEAHFVRAQLAAGAPAADYMKKAIAAMEREGVDVAAARRVIENPTAPPVPWIPADASAAYFEAIADYLQAAVIERIERGELALNAALQNRLAVSRAKLYLQEFGKRYDRAVQLGAFLEALPFADPQLEEASRCLLNGFYRAAVTTAASALEGALKKKLERRRSYDFETLVNDALSAGVLGTDVALQEQAMEVWHVRNNVVHEGWSPDKAAARTAVDRVRKILEFIHDAQPRP